MLRSPDLKKTRLRLLRRAFVLTSLLPLNSVVSLSLSVPLLISFAPPLPSFIFHVRLTNLFCNSCPSCIATFPRATSPGRRIRHPNGGAPEPISGSPVLQHQQEQEHQLRLPQDPAGTFTSGSNAASRNRVSYHSGIIPSPLFQCCSVLLCHIIGRRRRVKFLVPKSFDPRWSIPEIFLCGTSLASPARE